MYFSKALVVLSIAVSAMASPHMARGMNHRAVAHRAAMPVAEPDPMMVPQHKKHRKRQSTNRCKVRSTTSSTVTPTSTSIIPPKNVASDPPTSPATTQEVPTTTKADPTTQAEPTTQAQPTTTKQAPTTKEEPTTTSTPPPPTTTKKTTAAAPTTTQASSGGGGSASDPLGILDGNHTGEGTYYDTGLGSCGITNKDTDFIAAVSHTLYDNFPGYNRVNPNNNPLCKRMIRATYQGKSVEVMAVDRCVGCATFDLDFSPSAFAQLADFAVGRLQGVTWEWI